VFPAASYQYVLYAWVPTEVEPLENAGTQSMAAKLVNENIANDEAPACAAANNRDLFA